ncbi:MAG TPA: FG-GAP-like repeat-containing protein, partial [Oceanipulchritudo sp.]|nr:FG-GAP-like repeat-containing protein [Oceanipulchritudo sp.]
GTFAPVVYSGVDSEEANPSDIDAADLDGDGILDIVVAHNASWQTSNAAALYGNGDGSFMGLRRFYTDSYRSEIYLDDLNDDGIPDFLVGNHSSTRYYLGTGDREEPFAGSVVFFNYDDAYGIAIDDFDLDGRTDLILAEPNDDALLFLAGNAVNRPLADATAAGFHQALGRGNLRDTDDVDWYAFTAREGERIVLLTENANPGDSSARLRFQIYGPGINSKINTTSSWTGGHLQTDPYTATADGTYYVRVSRSQNYFSEYRFRLTIAPADYQLENESNDRISNATPLAFAQAAGERSANVLGQFMPGDSDGDFYRIGNLAAGTEVELTYTNTEDSAATPKLWLYSDDGSFNGIIIAEEAEGQASLSFTTTADGTYLARVTTLNDDLDFFSEYRLSIVLTDTEPPAIVSDTLPTEGSTSDDLLIAFTLTFNEDLDADSVNDPDSFELRGAGGDGLFNTADDFLISLENFNYTSGLSQLLTLETNPLQPGNYRFTAFSGGIKDLFGNTLPTDYVRQFTITGLPGYLSEGTDNDTLKTADPLTTNPPGNLPGSFTFAAATAVSSDNPQGLRLVDVDNDGLPDAVVASAYDDRLRVYFSNGEGTFTEGPDYPIGNEVYFMEKADVDGDGDEDILLAERDSSSGLRLFRNNADGTLADLGLLSGGINPSGMATGDLDGMDGIDLVMANLGSSTN